MSSERSPDAEASVTHDASRPVGVAVVGLGWWGRHLIGKLAASDLLTVVTTVDSDPAADPEVCDIDVALADDAVEAVVICVPHSAHHELIVRCAAAGRHVFCEKPLTLTAGDAIDALDACHRSGVVLGVGHERRFEEPWSLVREHVASGDLGTVLYAEGALSHDKFLGLDAAHWRGSETDAPAAGMTGMGVHLTDILISMLGPVSEVNAYVGHRELALPSGDVVSVQLRFESGAFAAVSAVSVTPFYGRLAVFGTHGWIEVRDDGHPELGTGATVTTCFRGGEPTSRHVAAEGDAVLDNLEAFAGAVRGRAPYPIPDDELVHNVAVLEATATSARERRPANVAGHTSGGR